MEEKKQLNSYDTEKLRETAVEGLQPAAGLMIAYDEVKTWANWYWGREMVRGRRLIELAFWTIHGKKCCMHNG